MAVLTPTQVSYTGQTLAPVAASAGGDSCNVNDHLALFVKNGGASSITLTLVTPQVVYGQAVPDIVITIAAGGEELIAVGQSDLADANGHVNWTYSATASVTVQLLRF